MIYYYTSIISTKTARFSNTMSVDDYKLQFVTGADVSIDSVTNASLTQESRRSKDEEATVLATNEVGRVVIDEQDVELFSKITIAKDDRPSCHDMDLDSLTKGEWDETSNIWKPDACQHIPFKTSDIQQCIADKTITFYGDSLLRNIANELIKIALGAGGNDRGKELATWASSPYLLGGGGSIKGGGKIAMYWTPSAYHQTPSSVGSMEQDDASIIGIGVWDMGTYYRGVNTWHAKMKALLTAAARKQKGSKPIFVMHLHKLYSSKCKRVHDTDAGLRKYKICQACNGDDMVQKFRSALEHAVQCVRSNGFKNVYLLDAFGITNSTFAEKHTDDGVHYDTHVTQMELEILMSGVCHGMRHHKNQVESLVCPAIPNFEPYKKSSGLVCSSS